MKRMFLMTLVLSVIAMGSAMANDNSSAKRPKKSNVVVVVDSHHGVPCNCRPCDCHKFDPCHKPYNHHHNNNKGCEWNKGHNPGKHPGCEPNFNGNNNRPPKMNGGPGKATKPAPGYGRK